MVANPARRVALADAAITVLGEQGARGLTHRAVDVLAGLPKGTASNYFPSRAALLLGAAERIFVRLTPEDSRVGEIEASAGDDTLVDYVQYVLERLLAAPQLALALIELRLAAARSADVAEVIAPFLRAGLAADVEFHRTHGLSGGTDRVVLLHHLVDGLVLDRLTVPLQPDRDPADVAAEFVRALRSR
ncbi:TetR family transcriptional regulator [Epidermidibacterium keratini]|uniref:TetR family transcriptional regulator n=1 Tax=Epidermidibacterium keratini TaxID=1891644 RepID=A0A7L4YL00_9ACTN|nr:TetR/AcrR family transcriptional regulator [Epidermidibacterium keratini]QHB99865.1 TetR family transcriptional regulator [Epidermidibacterium keratini]